MTDWRAEVKKDSPFLYHWDIDGLAPVKVTITGVVHKEAFCPGKNEKGVLWCLQLKGATKVFGVNVTNGHLLAHALGTTQHEQWLGKSVWLRIANVHTRNQGVVRAIRVHAPGAKLPSQCPRFVYADDEPKEEQ